MKTRSDEKFTGCKSLTEASPDMGDKLRVYVQRFLVLVQQRAQTHTSTLRRPVEAEGKQSEGFIGLFIGLCTMNYVQ